MSRERLFAARAEVEQVPEIGVTLALARDAS